MINNIIVFITFLFISCNRSDFHTSIDMNWKVVNKKIHNGILVYEGYNPDVPLRAWSVIIPKNKQNKISILVPHGGNSTDTPQNLAMEKGAIVAINGGYFTRGKFPINHVGLLKSNNVLIEPASISVIRGWLLKLPLLALLTYAL